MILRNSAVKTGPEWGGFGAYIHWPYCRRICAYCDFNVYKHRDDPQDHLVKAIIADMARHRAFLPEHTPLDSVYFGGGTPSLLHPTQIETIINAARTHFGLSQTCEITLEANPTDVTAQGCEGWRAAGVNRVSLGVQSLDDAALKWLTRDHTGATAAQAVEIIRAVFSNFSVDAIYALPDQSLATWHDELARFLALNAPHYALYELTIKSGTAFGVQTARGDWTPADEDAQADLYELTEESMAVAGLHGYEISNYARSPAFESAHNTIYWQSGDWLGLGPGAHGRLTRGGARHAYEAPRTPDAYIKSVAAPFAPPALTPLETIQELLAMGLRQAEGIAFDRFGPFKPDIGGGIIRTNDLNGQSVMVLDEKTGKLRVNTQFRLLTDLLTRQVVEKINL